MMRPAVTQETQLCGEASYQPNDHWDAYCGLYGCSSASSDHRPKYEADMRRSVETRQYARLEIKPCHRLSRSLS